MDESLKILGTLKVTLKDKDGNVKEEHNFKNLVVNGGLGYLVHALAYAINISGPFNYIAIGTGTSAPSAGNTALQTEIARGGIGYSASDYNYITFQTTFSPGTGTGTITEAGIFSGSSGGLMFSRTTFTPIVKHSTDSLIVSWTINFASA